METFASRLKKERVRKNLSQRALAALCGVQQNAQAHYEKGHRLPKADYLMLAAGVMDVGYLLRGVHTSEDIDSLSDIENDVVSALRKMPQDDQQAITSICLALARHMK